MRLALRILAFLLAVPVLALGLGGLGISRSDGVAAFDAMVVEVEKQAREGGAPEEVLKAAQETLFAPLRAQAELLATPAVYGGALGLGGVLMLYCVWPRRGRRRAAAAEAEDDPDVACADAGEGEDPGHTAKAARKYRKTAAQMLEEEGPDEAANYLLDLGMKDEAVDLLIRNDACGRAAEIRYDQNRFEEAADLYGKAGRHEAAGSIYAQIERFEDAGRCYAEADKQSVAGEMYERAGDFLAAGRCYREIGFMRHAAQAFLKAGSDKDAAEALVAAFREEGGGGKAVNDSKAKELKGLAKKAGELLCKLERFEEAENILVRAQAFGQAAKVAYQTGAYQRAADLFLRVGRGDLAAKALKRHGDHVGSARALGEYLRDKGDDAEAAVQLEKAEEFGSAGDLFRKQERYDDAARCYTSGGDFGAAAEMFRAAGNVEQAAECYERSKMFGEAAACLAQSGNLARQAELLEKAGRAVDAGRIWAENDRLDDAIRVLQQVDPSDPGYGDACALLGRLFHDKGMHTLSVKKLEEAAGEEGITRENAEAHYELARVLEAREDWARSAEIYDRILSFDYHYRDVSEAAERVKAALERHNALSELSAAQSGVVPITQGAPVTRKRYEIIRELGRGGMGVVHLARDSVLEREVAYKVLPEGLRQNPNALKNFLREAKAAAQLNHPHIVTVYDAGESEHGFYLAMELVEGTTLKEVLRHRGPIAPGGVIYILRQMAEALAYAHGKKVVHRDIKTANTMWTTEKQVKIMDFGLAKLMEEVRNATTMISGTPFYMSPEQTLGRNVDHRTDLYSLGVTVFELATGELPFRKGNVPYHHVHTPPPDPTTVKADLPPALAQMILRCLEKDPEARFQTARELVEEIDRLSGRPAS